jgi:hypothetical protein
MDGGSFTTDDSLKTDSLKTDGMEELNVESGNADGNMDGTEEMDMDTDVMKLSFIYDRIQFNFIMGELTIYLAM